MAYDGLVTARKRLGVSQDDMAMLLGLRSRNAYCLKENGRRKFSVEEALCIARVMKLPVEALFSVGTEVNKMVTKAPRREN